VVRCYGWWTVKFIEPKIPVVGSVATTLNVVEPVTDVDVVERSPVLESILTFVIELGFVVHVTESVTGNVPLPVVAVAVNWFDPPNVMLVTGEVTVILVMPLSVTVMVALPLKVPEEPVMLDVPGETPVTRPLVLLTVATVGVALFQNTPEVIVLVVPSLKVPVAVICTVLDC
jgi:hypothetical protein